MINNSHEAMDYAETIIEEYSNMVYRLSITRTKNISDAEDVFQEVFIRYLKNHKKINNSEHLKSWLIRVTINCSKSLLTSAWFRHTEPLSEDFSFSTPEKSQVYYATLELPLKYRTIIYLFYYEDLSISEISRITHIKESTIKSQLSRGRALLKEMLKGEID